MLKTMQKHGVTLALFAILATGLTAVVNALTKDTIEQQAVAQQKLLFDQVISADIYDNKIQSSSVGVTSATVDKDERHIPVAGRTK